MTAKLIGGEMTVWSDLDGKHGPGPVSAATLRPLLATASGRTLVAGPHDPGLLASLPSSQLTLLARGLPDAERLAADFAGRPEVTVLCGSLEKLAAAPTYDTVIALDGLGRLRSAEDDATGESWADDLARLVAVLRPGGRLLLGLENLLGLHRLLAVAPEPADADWSGADEFDPSRPASPAQLREALAAADLSLIAEYAAFPSQASVLLGPALLADRSRRGWVTATLRAALTGPGPALADPGRIAAGAARAGIAAELAPAWIVLAQHGASDDRPLPAAPDAPVFAQHGASDDLPAPDQHGVSDDGSVFAAHGAFDDRPVPAQHGVSDDRPAPAQHGVSDGRPLLDQHGVSDDGSVFAQHGASDDRPAPAQHGASDDRPAPDQHGASDDRPVLPAAVLADGVGFTEIWDSAELPVGLTLDEVLLGAALRRDMPALRELLTGWQASDAAGVPADRIVAGPDGTRTALVKPGEPGAALQLLAATMIREGYAYLWPAPADEAELTALLAAMAGVEVPAPPGGSETDVDLRELLMERDRLTRELAEARARHRWYETMLLSREAELKRVRRINTMLLATLPGKAAKASYAGLRRARQAARRLKG